MPKIVDFERDADGDWVALLDCGHRQHTRHDPPRAERPWVLTKEGRAQRLGTLLVCPWCRMPKLPENVTEYHRSKDFTDETVPSSLVHRHTTKTGTWGEIVVTRGRVLYFLDDEEKTALMLTPEQPGIVAPEQPHHVAPQPGAQFFVRFLREA